MSLHPHATVQGGALSAQFAAKGPRARLSHLGLRPTGPRALSITPCTFWKDVGLSHGHCELRSHCLSLPFQKKALPPTPRPPPLPTTPPAQGSQGGASPHTHPSRLVALIAPSAGIGVFRVAICVDSFGGSGLLSAPCGPPMGGIAGRSFPWGRTHRPPPRGPPVCAPGAPEGGMGEHLGDGLGAPRPGSSVTLPRHASSRPEGVGAAMAGGAPGGPPRSGEFHTHSGWVTGPVFDKIVMINLWSLTTIVGNRPVGGSRSDLPP